MAAVLDALAPYVKKLIMDMAEEEVSMLLGVSDEITKLGDKVENLEAYVADAERRRINDATVQRWVSKLKGALYEATDILELCQLDAEERRYKQAAQGGCLETNKAPRCLLSLLFCLRKPSFAHAMGRRIKDLNTRLDGICQDMADLRLQVLTPSPVKTPPGEATPLSRATTSLFDEDAIVGEAIEMSTKDLVQELLLANDDPQEVKVVSITAAGGMGKTTLAKKIFNDSDIQAEFRCRIWLSVTESYNPEKLLSSAITQARGVDNNLHGDQQVLTQTLVRALSEAGKFLLVLDDVWSKEPWTSVLQSPIIEAGRRQPGSRVIITTRKKDLVKDMGATYYLHNVKPLSDEDAWALLQKQLLPLQDVRSKSALDHLKHIGMEIVRNCDGLPLAIKAIGGLLRTKEATEHEWRGVLHDPSWKMDKTHDDLNIALHLSYEDLSPQLKQCFLYLSLNPKEFNIEQDSTIGMWMSQGFLKVPAGTSEAGHKEVEDVGMDYYRDLIRRNLIEPIEMFKDASVCCLHDVVRSFGQYMAKEEALSVVGAHQLTSLVSSPKLRHLSISSPKLESESAVLPRWSSIPENQKLLRSLIISGRMSFEPRSNVSSLSRFASLRTLFVHVAESDRLLGSIGQLKHLRFLALAWTDISRLPDDIGKMKFLEHIQLVGCRSFDGQIPSSVLKLERLRCLAIEKYTKFNVPKGFGGLTNLRYLSIFPAQMDGEWCSLQELGPLCRLRRVDIGCLEAVPSGLLAAKARISDKMQLRYLALLCYKLLKEFPGIDGLLKEMTTTTEDMWQQQQMVMEGVVHQLCPPPPLEHLVIRNYIGRQPPGWMCATATANFNSLIQLDMAGLPFCTQLPDGLCQLHSLELLMIDYALAIRHVGPEFQGRRTGSLVPFPRLQHLRFKVLPEWEEWEWKEEEAQNQDIMIAMPSLQKLSIFECKLLRLPTGLASIRRHALRELYLVDCARITTVENFPSVVQLVVFGCPSLNIIRGFRRMQYVGIVACPAVEVLEAGPALDVVELEDPDMETLPEYLRGLKPRILQLSACHQKLRDLLLSSSTADEYKAEMGKVNLKQGGKLVVL